jgi:hypothetical protein
MEMRYDHAGVLVHGLAAVGDGRFVERADRVQAHPILDPRFLTLKLVGSRRDLDNALILTGFVNFVGVQQCSTLPGVVLDGNRGQKQAGSRSYLTVGGKSVSSCCGQDTFSGYLVNVDGD